MSHRLPEVYYFYFLRPIEFLTDQVFQEHTCVNLSVCKEEAFAANAKKLHAEAKGVHVRPESIVRGESTDR
jgi:hypothetical protein